MKTLGSFQVDDFEYQNKLDSLKKLYTSSTVRVDEELLNNSSELKRQYHLNRQIQSSFLSPQSGRKGRVVTSCKANNKSFEFNHRHL